MTVMCLYYLNSFVIVNQRDQSSQAYLNSKEILSFNWVYCYAIQNTKNKIKKQNIQTYPFFKSLIGIDALVWRTKYLLKFIHNKSNFFSLADRLAPINLIGCCLQIYYNLV